MRTSTPVINVAKKRAFVIAAWVVAGLALLEVAPATATTLRALSLEQLAARSVAVVRARVRQQRAEWRQGVIVTLSEVEVLEVLRGQAEPTLTVLQLGGQVGAHAMPVLGAAPLVVDEEWVLFVRRLPGPTTTYELAGMSQGALRVEREGDLRWAPTALLWDGQRLQAPGPRRLSLAALRAQLRGDR